MSNVNNTSLYSNASESGSEGSTSSWVMYTALYGYDVTYIYFLIAVILTIFSFFIIFMNLVVAATLAKEENQTEFSEYFVASLAVNDAIYGVVLIYNNVYNLTNIQFTIECNFRICCIWMLALNSGMHLMVLAIDRVIKISKPFAYARYFFKKSIIVFSTLTWVTSFIIGFLPLFGWRKTLVEKTFDEEVCLLLGITDENYLRLFTSAFGFTMVTMVVAYGVIFKIARSQALAIAASEKNTNFENGNKKTKLFDQQAWKFTKTFAIVVLFYVLMATPSGTILFLKVTERLDHLSLQDQGTAFLYCSFASIANLIVNPIIYAIKIRSVKERFRSICCWPWCNRT